VPRHQASDASAAGSTSAARDASAAHEVRVRQCTQCGATIEMDVRALSAQCAYCDAPLVDEQRATTRLDAVAPFRVTREIAVAKLHAFLRSKPWAPRAVKTLAVDGRSLRGVLVPHWAFDGVVRSSYDAHVGIYWYRTETYRDSKGQRRTRTVRETEWFPLSGTAARQIENHLVSASVGLPEAESNALEPFDLGWAVPVDSRLLSGFEAEVPSIAREPALTTASEELRNTEAKRIKDTLLPGDVNRVERIDSQVEIARCRAVLLPVWITTYVHKNVTRRLVVNGQTGRCAGDVPVSATKVTVAVVLGLLVIGLILLAVFWRQP
jgi:hypothetical protein